MAKEFNPYFYVSKKDVQKPQAGKLVGLIIVVTGILLLLLRMIGVIATDYILILIYLGFGLVSLFLGKIIHHDQAGKPKKPKETNSYKRPPPRSGLGY